MQPCPACTVLAHSACEQGPQKDTPDAGFCKIENAHEAGLDFMIFMWHLKQKADQPGSF